MNEVNLVCEPEVEEEEDLGYNRFDPDIGDEGEDCNLFDTPREENLFDCGNGDFEPPEEDDGNDPWDDDEPEYRLPANWKKTWENDVYFPAPQIDVSTR